MLLNQIEAAMKLVSRFEFLEYFMKPCPKKCLAWRSAQKKQRAGIFVPAELTTLYFYGAVERT